MRHYLTRLETTAYQFAVVLAQPDLRTPIWLLLIGDETATRAVLAAGNTP